MPMPAAHRCLPCASPSRHAWRRLLGGLLLALLAESAGSAHADTLLQVLAAAQRDNPTLRSARADCAAALQQIPLARSRLLPQLRASADLGENLHDETGNPLLRMFGMAPHWNFVQRDLALSATQQLYDPADGLAVQQARLAADAAYVRLAQAEQRLMLEVAQDYFALLGADDTLRTLRRQQAAIARQLAQARARFAAGSGTVLDLRDAQARADLLRAQRVAARGQRQVALDRLRSVAGTAVGAPAPLLADARLPQPPSDAAAWAQRARRDNLQVTQARLQLRIAHLQLQRARSNALPTVQAYARVDRLSTSGGGSQFPFGDRVDSASVGVRVQWPLFTGYALRSEQRGSAARLEQAQADVDAARDAAALQARSALADWEAAHARARALRAALRSSRSALQAERTGFAAGLRVNLDVLDALAQLYDTERQEQNARYDSLLDGLRLRLATGRLDTRDLAEVDALLRQRPPAAPGQSIE